MPMTPLSIRCPLPKADGSPCRRGIREGLFTCAWHNRTPEGAAFNRKKRLSAFHLDEARAEERKAEREGLKALAAWASDGALAIDSNLEPLKRAANQLLLAQRRVWDLKTEDEKIEASPARSGSESNSSEPRSEESGPSSGG